MVKASFATFLSGFKFYVGTGVGTEIGVQCVEAGNRADSLRVYRGITVEHQPLFAELFPVPAEMIEFHICALDRDGRKRRTYYFTYARMVPLAAVFFDARSGTPALEGVELQGVKLERWEDEPLKDAGSA